MIEIRAFAKCFFTDERVGVKMSVDNLFVGKLVVISDNAFEGSDDPNDFTFRGMEAEVIEFYPDGCVTVATTRGVVYLNENEIEAASNG
jgi:hypothetical protein